MTVVERCAVAVEAAAKARKLSNEPEPMDDGIWLVREVLKAIREPSEGMMQAAEKLGYYTLGSSTPTSWADQDTVWQAMIDAALAEDAG